MGGDPVPVQGWNNPEQLPEEPVVWRSRLDKRYLIEVVRTDDNVAQFRMFDHDHDDRLVMDEPVGLAYGAMFGPDVDDVSVWQERAMYVADHPDEFAVTEEE